MSVTLAYGVSTDVGLVRSLNEDAILCESTIFAVADGMGGHAAGEVASRIAVSAIGDLCRRSPLHVQDVIDAIDAANTQILDASRADGAREGMGTTLAGLCLVSFNGADHWLVFNVGDSRVYRFWSGELTQLSKDHSEIEELIDNGQITAEQARTHPRRNVITRSLGTMPAPVADTWLLPVQSGERFVICSDGLIIELTDAEVRCVLEGSSIPQHVANALVTDAVRSGGRDNISVVVVDVFDDVVSDLPDAAGADVTAPRASVAPYLDVAPTDKAAR